jgi:hypothetical protein
MVTVNLSAERYDEFLRCISLLKEDFDDVDIRDGVIRQRTNDNSAVFEMDLNPIIPDLSMPLTNLKQKIELLKCFSEQEVEITVNERDYSFADRYSSFRFSTPNLEFMNNKFMPDEEANSILIADESDCILNCSIEKVISDRIRIITSNFNVNNIRVIFEDDQASITTEAQSKDQYANLVSGILSNRSMNNVTNIVSIPFTIDHDGDMSFSMYNIQENICLNRISTAISDIDINVYCRSSLVEPESG